ncbi:MAG: SDR family oxidoreductase [Chitinophagales bacterium]|nr:SDR family oxidoreductase [Chitinophagales bacterium]
MQKSNPKKQIRKPQQQDRPGKETEMEPVPDFDNKGYQASGKLKGKVALITGGDSGIGRAVAILFAKEGASVAIGYFNEHEDAAITKKKVDEYGQNCILIAGDLSRESLCKKAVALTIKKFGKLDILINNAGMHYPAEDIKDITSNQLMKTFSTNFFSMVWITQAALESMQKGGVIINTASVTAYRGSSNLIDYSATKGAIVSFTRSLSANLIEKGIRVNGVAPGPVWTPLIVSSFDEKKVATFGSDVPMKRAGEPVEIAPCYLFLASSDSSYMTGQFLHPNGGEIVNG